MGTLLCAIAISALGTLAANAADEAGTKAGLLGKIVKVDVEKKTVTIATMGGHKQTFTVTDDTTIVGPRGGLVHRRLQDRRFHPGLGVTVVANEGVADEIHLGVDRPADRPKGGLRRMRLGFRGTNAGTKQPEVAHEADDENDFPGTIKSVDPEKRMLVITLLTGKDESFILANETKILIGETASEKGLADARLKPGTYVIVLTEGGKKVKEVKTTRKTARKAS